MEKSFNKVIKYVLSALGIGFVIVWAVYRGPSYSVKADNVIKVACAPDYPGGSFYIKGEFVGKEIDILKKIFKDSSLELVLVGGSDVKHFVKNQMCDVGCGGWCERNDGSIYSSPIIENIKLCDIVKGDWQFVDSVFVQSSTIFAEYAVDTYKNVIKFDDLMDCINNFKSHVGPKRLILDSINFDSIKDSIDYDSFKEHGDYNICLLCKDGKTKAEVDIRIAKYIKDE
jgi:hypothetical protein